MPSNKIVPEEEYMARPKLSMLFGLIVSLAFAGLLFGQRGDRGIITGVVTDPAGAAVPAATVTIIDEGTKVATALSTGDTGNYGSPPLILGIYTVRVEKEGFKTFVRTGIELAGGITYRQDATLQLGTVTQTVEVSAASEMINVSSAEVGHSLRSITRIYRWSWERIFGWRKPCCTPSRATFLWRRTATLCSAAAGSTRGLTAAKPWRQRTGWTGRLLVMPAATNKPKRVLPRTNPSGK